MDVFSTELEIRLTFVKTSEFRWGRGECLNPPKNPRYATELLVIQFMIKILHAGLMQILIL
jgi:hypothetical protein